MSEAKPAKRKRYTEGRAARKAAAKAPAVIPAERVCGQCGGPLTASPPQDFGDAINVDLDCPTCGPQFTISTTKPGVK